MYQRLAMVCVNPISAADPEDERDHKANHLIGEQKEHGSERHHDEHHCGGDCGLATRRPSDLFGLGAHFLHELERACFCHNHFNLRAMISRADLPPLPIRDCLRLAISYAWQEWRDSNPQPPVLETGALAD